MVLIDHSICKVGLKIACFPLCFCTGCWLAGDGWMCATHSTPSWAKYVTASAVCRV